MAEYQSLDFTFVRLCPRGRPGNRRRAYLTTGSINFTFPRANTLFNGFGFWLYNNNAGAATFIDSHDTVQGCTSGTSDYRRCGRSWCKADVWCK
jgi:hypothetical protein